MAKLDPSYNEPFFSYDQNARNNDFKSFRDDESTKSIAYADANLVNAYMTERSNYQNMLQWQATNAWNKYMWDLENEYNAPSQQVQRLLEAGINPLWAMQSGDAGNAQQLTAQQMHPVTPPSFSYEPRSLDQQMSMFQQTNALNSLLGMGDLDVKNRNLAIQDKLSNSEIQKTQAEINLIKEQTESNSFINKINSQTYGVQVNQKIADLNFTREQINQLKAQQDLTKAQEKLLKTSEEKEQLLKDQVVAATRKIEQDILNDLYRLQLETEQIAISWQNANSASLQASAAATQASASMMNSRTSDAALNHQIEKDTKELELKTNEQILQIMENTRSWIDKAIGNPGNIGEEIFGGSGMRFKNAISMVKAGTKVLFQRFYSNPTKANADAIDRINRLIQDLQSRMYSIPMPIPLNTPANTSVSNPSQSWSSQ